MEYALPVWYKPVSSNDDTQIRDSLDSQSAREGSEAGHPPSALRTTVTGILNFHSHLVNDRLEALQRAIAQPPVTIAEYETWEATLNYSSIEARATVEDAAIVRLFHGRKMTGETEAASRQTTSSGHRSLSGL
ncbi:hypothetical protein DFH08DRAFT_818504 [Mycena albidolilacea]|uniref:Uncharacterized protein n=1 Tax=Mycena albidolilacea TaxID=1033008 RepID=A0AAD7EHD5_9AGAR|nr:hypothetical protein DFH08DRAFT_818504 [Mycena albidolilacea]